MKTVITFTLLIFTLLSAQAQSIDVGSKWTYAQGYFFTFPLPTLDSVRVLEVKGDTIINNEEYFLIDGYCNCSSSIPIIARWADNRVYQYLNNKKSILYDFNLQAGDTLIVQTSFWPGTVDSVRVFIDEVGMSEGKIVQYVSIDYNHPEIYAPSDWSGVFLQDIGSLDWCLTPQNGLCESPSGGLCRVESADGLVDHYNEEGGCVIVNTSDILIANVSIFPNPMSESLHIKAQQSIVSINIYDALGRNVYTDHTDGHREEIINVSSLFSGVYTVTIESKEGTTAYKVVKD